MIGMGGGRRDNEAGRTEDRRRRAEGEKMGQEETG